ncbi:MAG TPA: malonyl-ACP O-methyltransferase BioC [Steroidobacter sp.]|jgi:malonyl-CoA O-methyltransferase|nr:malonyl-ACP O-methyltransferase BioC [Steroidobacter sp.]
MAAPHDDFFLDSRTVRRAFDAASATYESAAGVQAEIRARLLERLEVVRLQPAVVLDIGAGAGHGARALKQRYRRAHVIALDLSERMLQAAARQGRFFRRFGRVAGDAGRLPFKDASVDLVFSNLTLEWGSDPDGVFAEVRRVLAPNGLFTFTTLGPDTLKELRDAWARVDHYPHVHRFIDMHDLGDALMRARFAEPVMDVERLTITYSSLSALHRELKRTGSRNLTQGRRTSLTGRVRGRALQAQVETLKRDGVVPMSVEVVYGHAWAGELRAPRAPSGEVRVPLTGLRSRR